MAEAAALHREGRHGVRHRGAVLDEAAVGEGVNAQRCQRHQHLRRGFAILRPPAGEAAVGELGVGQQRQRLVHRRLHRRLPRVGGQRRQRHGGDVHVHRVAHQRPAAVGAAGGQQLLHQRGAGHRLRARCGRRVGICAAVQRDQRPDGAVQSLTAKVFHVAQPRRQIHARHIGGVVSGGGDAQDRPGVLRGLIGVQPVPLRLRRVFHDRLVVDGGRLPLQQAGGAKPHHRPVTVHRAGGWGVLRQQVLPGLPEGGLPRGLLPAGRLCAAGGEQQAQQQDKRQDILFLGGHGRFLLTEIPYISAAVFRPVPHGAMSASRPAPAN